MLAYFSPRLSEMLYTNKAVPYCVPEAQPIHPPGHLISHWPKQLENKGDHRMCKCIFSLFILGFFAFKFTNLIQSAQGLECFHVTYSFSFTKWNSHVFLKISTVPI